MFMEEKRIKMRDGVELYTKVKENGSPVWIIATHGIGEHLGRHQYLSDLFGHDFNLFQYDLRGHGKSDGKKAYIDDFSLYMEDLKEIIRLLSSKYRMERFILFGHSMGALITASFMQNYVEDNHYPERVIINAPPVGAHGILDVVLKILPTKVISGAANLPYSVPVKGLVDLKALSHDPRIFDSYVNDELNALSLHSKLLLELVKTAKMTFSRPLRVRCSAYVTYGTSDRVVGSKAIEEYFDMVDKSFNVKAFEGAYHEIHNEIEKYRKPYFDHLKSIFQEVLYPENN
jgi:alpha-beta hydrolase superfamily lysophospholipase